MLTNNVIAIDLAKNVLQEARRDRAIVECTR